MFKRVLVAVVGIPLLLAVFVWAPDWATMLLLSAMCAIGAHELMHAVAGEQGRKLTPLTVLAAALVPLEIYRSAPHHGEVSLLDLQDATSGTQAADTLLPLLAMGLILFLFAYAILHYGKKSAVSFADVTGAIFAGIVFPWMLACLLRLRLMTGGQALIFLPLCIAFGSDTFALFAGMLFGKHKLSPLVSPKKTVEGAMGGLCGGVIGMALLTWIVGNFAPQFASSVTRFGWSAVIPLGVIGSVVSQIGDLSFSVIKREFGVKDYGKLLPGHGGILDRFDSVTFVAPFVWMILEVLE